jgi:hypothetical protein
MRGYSGQVGFNLMRGITIMPEYIQSEGVESVLSRLEAAGITQIGTSPYVMIPTEEGVGHREPPVDAGSGKVRLLDRPLWGKRELWFRTTPSFVPNLELYRGLRYQPPECEGEPDTVLHDFIGAARHRGMEVYLQIQAAIPPSLRVQFGGPVADDTPCLPDGTHPKNPLSKNASLASPEILAYTQALSCDLLEQYAEVAGIRYDWPEYPCYHLDTVFTDFNPQVARFADEYGFDLAAMQLAVGRLYKKLQKLTDADLDSESLFELSEEPDEIAAWLRFKKALVTDYTMMLCGVPRAFGKKSILHAFPPPFSDLTGFDFSENAKHADAIGMKLYTMHLPMILRNYGTQLLEWNPALDEARLTAFLNRWLDLGDESLGSLNAYAYPPPEQAHQITGDAQIRKIRRAAEQAPNTHVMTHTYGPVNDFAKRLRLAIDSSPDGIWLNRYAYLDDEKYEVLRAVN